MLDNIPKQKINQPKIKDLQHQPQRVPARMEGVVRNRGIKNVKKSKQ